MLTLTKGYVSDGWALVNGRFVYSPPQPERCNLERDPRRLRLKMLEAAFSSLIDDLLDFGEIPGVAAATIDGQRPRASRLIAARQALQRLPRVFLKAALVTGKRIEIVPGTDAGKHPNFRRQDKPRGIANGRLAAVAADDDDFQATVLHEFAHLLDQVRGAHWLSYADDWMELWGRDVAAGVVPEFANQRGEPCEYFSESAATFWNGAGGRLSAGVQAYMRALPGRFSEIA